MTSRKRIIKAYNIYLKALIFLPCLQNTIGMTQHDPINPIPWKRECIHDNRTQCHMPGHWKEIDRREHCYECSVGTPYCVTDYVTNLTYYVCVSDEEIMCNPGYYGQFRLLTNWKIGFEKLTCPIGTHLLRRRDCRKRICKRNTRIDPELYHIVVPQTVYGQAALVRCKTGLCVNDPSYEEPFAYKSYIDVCTKPLAGKECSKPNVESRNTERDTSVSSTTVLSPVTVEMPNTTLIPKLFPSLEKAVPNSTANPIHQTSGVQITAAFIPVSNSSGHINVNTILLVVLVSVIAAILAGFFVILMCKRRKKTQSKVDNDAEKPVAAGQTERDESVGTGTSTHTRITNKFKFELPGGTVVVNDKVGTVNVNTVSPSTSSPPPSDLGNTSFIMDEVSSVHNGDAEAASRRAPATAAVQASDAEPVQATNTSQATRETVNSAAQMEQVDTYQASFQSMQIDGIQSRDTTEGEGLMEETYVKTVADQQSNTDEDQLSIDKDLEETSPLLSEEEKINIGGTDPSCSMSTGNRNISPRKRHTSCGDSK